MKSRISPRFIARVSRRVTKLARHDPNDDDDDDDHVGDRHYVALSFLRDMYSRNCEIGDFFESVNDTRLLGVDLHDEG